MTAFYLVGPSTTVKETTNFRSVCSGLDTNAKKESMTFKDVCAGLFYSTDKMAERTTQTRSEMT
jgi:hypothetical protein